MKKLQPLVAAVALSILLSVTTFADGIIETGITNPPPPPTQTSTTTTTQPGGTTTPATTPPAALTEAALALLQALLGLLP